MPASRSEGTSVGAVRTLCAKAKLPDPDVPGGPRPAAVCVYGDLVDVARQIQDADAILGVKVGSQLDVIAEQIRSLQDKARTILEEARVSAELHRASCSFKKRVGASYCLYRRSDGAAYFSMLSPEEWGASCPHRFEGAFRLEPDMTFRRLEV